MIRYFDQSLSVEQAGLVAKKLEEVRQQIFLGRAAAAVDIMKTEKCRARRSIEQGSRD